VPRISRTNRLTAGCWAGLALLVFTTACGPSPAPNSAGEALKPPAGAAAAPEGGSPVIDEHRFAAHLERFRGKVLLVDYWATWCGPCLEVFAHSVELHRKLGDQGLAVVGLSLDSPKSKAAVDRFVKSKAAAFDNFISTYGTGTRSVEAFELGDGALPLVKLFDRQGKLVQSFGGDGTPIDPQQVDAAVAGLLKR